MDAKRTGRTGALICANLGALLAGTLLGGALPQFPLHALFAYAAAMGAAWTFGPLVAAEARRNLWRALLAGSAAGLLCLVSGGLAVSFSNWPYVLSDGTAHGIESYIFKPVLLAMVFGAVPAVVVGLGYGLITWLLVRRKRCGCAERRSASSSRRASRISSSG